MCSASVALQELGAKLAQVTTKQAQIKGRAYSVGSLCPLTVCDGMAEKALMFHRCGATLRKAEILLHRQEHIFLQVKHFLSDCDGVSV